MYFFYLKLSYLRYQVTIFLHVVIMVHLGLCFFILHLRSRSYGTPISTYHFCNLKLTFLIYKLFHMSCVNLCQICRVFLFYHNLFIFITICMSFFYHQYILVYLFFLQHGKKENLKCQICSLSVEKDESNVWGESWGNSTDPTK